MPVTYDATQLAALATVNRDRGAGGDVQILDGATVLATVPLTAGGGTVSGATWTLAFEAGGVPAVASGEADGARIRDSSGAAFITGLSVSLPEGAGELKLQNLSINSGQVIELNGGTIETR